MIPKGNGGKKKEVTLHFASIFEVHMKNHKLGIYSLIGEHMEFHKRRRRIKTTYRGED
jgi:hypothetical protein